MALGVPFIRRSTSRPRFLRPVNVIPYAPQWTSNIPAVIHNLPSASQLSSGLSNHSSACSEDDDIPNLSDVQVQDSVANFLERLRGGLDMGLNFLLNGDVSDSRATLRLASTISLILQSHASTNPQSKLKEHIRITALLRFVEHWKPASLKRFFFLKFNVLKILQGGYWQIEAIMPIPRPLNARKGMSIASFITALFIARVISAGDLQDCLYSLIACHPIHFDRLCAMHVMVTHANLRLCKSKYWLRTEDFRDRLVAVTPAFVWARDGPGSFFVMVRFFFAVVLIRPGCKLFFGF